MNFLLMHYQLQQEPFQGMEKMLSGWYGTNASFVFEGCMISGNHDKISQERRWKWN